MTAHPNAQILAQLAEIAKTNPEPWKRLEVQVGNGWLDCNEFTTPLNPNVIFRIKPATVHIGGVELEGPVPMAPEKGTKLWLLFDHTLAPDMPISFSVQAPGCIRWLNERRLFTSKEARNKYQDTLVKLANGETK